MLRVFSGHRGRVMRATFSPNGETILTASEDGSARLWETATGKQLRVFSGHRGLLDSAFFSPDGKTIVTASWDGTAKIWNADSGDLIRTLRGHERALSSAVFSPDGNHIATAARDSTVRIWDVATGRVLRVLRGHASSVNGAFFSPDGKTIVTAAWDTTARIWEVTSGKELQILKGHQGVVSHASFSPDGKHVITTSADGSVRLWDVAAGKELYARYSFKDGSYIIIAPDGRYDSSEGANPKYGHFVIDTPAGPEAVGFDQIDPSEFYYKGLAEAIMTGKYEPGKRSLYAEKPFPSVEQKLDGTNLTFTATDQGGGIGDVWIVINQTRQRVIPKGSVRSGVPVTVDLKELGYKPGLTVDIQAHNATNGLRSPLQSSFALSRSGALEQPQATQKDPTPSRFIAVLIGSEAYSGSGDLRALNFPGDDAIELAKALHAMVTTGGVAKPEITVITDEPTAAERLKGLDGVKVVRGATKANWLNTLNQYQKSDFTANDWLFLAFAGHGVAYEKKYYYLTAESTSGTPSQGRESLWESTAISEDEIQAQLSKAVASNKNLVIDTCAAGVASGARNNQGQITATVTAFSYGNQGAHLLYATSDSREAFEALDLRHGYLTYSLLRVLKSGMDSRQGDRALVVMSKKWFDQAAELTAEVASQRGPQQKPALQASGDFSLGSLTDAQRLAIALPDLLPGIFASRITDSTGDQADWLNDGVMAAVKPGIRGMAFVRVEQEQGTNVFSLSGVLAEAGGKVTINLRLNQTTARGERLRSPAMVVTTTRANAVEDVLKAAAKLYEGRRDWPRG
jgi:WD40 repeat protein